MRSRLRKFWETHKNEDLVRLMMHNGPWSEQDKLEVNRYIDRYQYTGLVLYKLTNSVFRIDKDDKTGYYQLWNLDDIEYGPNWSGWIVAKTKSNKGIELITSHHLDARNGISGLIVNKLLFYNRDSEHFGTPPPDSPPF